MENVVYSNGGYCYVAKIIGDSLKITRHCTAGGLAPWGSIFSKTYKVTTSMAVYDLLKEFAEGDAA